jgi:hypothetical protein
MRGMTLALHPEAKDDTTEEQWRQAWRGDRSQRPSPATLGAADYQLPSTINTGGRSFGGTAPMSAAAEKLAATPQVSPCPRRAGPADNLITITLCAVPPTALFGLSGLSCQLRPPT